LLPGCAYFLTQIFYTERKVKNTNQKLNNVINTSIGLARINNNAYLCTAKSGYCAGSMANNTLIKSDLTFSLEEVGSIFLSVL